MGLSSSKSKTKTTPIYNKQIEGAASTVTNTYNQQAPKISAVTDMLGSFAPEIANRFTQGDPNIQAAASYNQDVLSGKYLGNGNPYLDEIVAKSNNDVSNRLAASLGTRGLAGGSSFGDIISRAVADNGTKLRYDNYNAERARMDGAAGMATGIASGQYLPLSILQSIAESQQTPVRAAAGYGSSIGGLLGNYTNQVTKSTPAIGQIIAQMAANAAQAFAGGG